jgi:hypothetical protein
MFVALSCGVVNSSPNGEKPRRNLGKPNLSIEIPAGLFLKHSNTNPAESGASLDNNRRAQRTHEPDPKILATAGNICTEAWHADHRCKRFEKWAAEEGSARSCPRVLQGWEHW